MEDLPPPILPRTLFLPGLSGLVSSWSEFVRVDPFAGVTGQLLADVSGPLVLSESARTGAGGGAVPRETVENFRHIQARWSSQECMFAHSRNHHIFAEFKFPLCLRNRCHVLRHNSFLITFSFNMSSFAYLLIN